MIRTFFVFLLCLCVGISVGTFSASQAITHGLQSYTFEKGPWKTWHSIGKPSVDPYTHAKLVIHRWLPSSAFETLYFMSTEDDQGDTLNPKCSYLISGGNIKTNTWSLSVYQEREKEETVSHKFSVNSESILRNPTGNWQVQISPNIGPGNSITHKPGENYILLLRLYSYEQKNINDNFGPLPHIKKVSC